MVVRGLIVGLLILAGAAPVFPEVPIGTVVPDLAFVDFRYAQRDLDSFGAPKLFVLMFITNTCPVAQRYLPRVDRLAQEYAGTGVQFIAVNVGPGDSIADMAAHGLNYAIKMPIVKDATGAATVALGMTRTPEVAILDGDRVLRYRGRVDDQYRLGGVKPVIGRHDLKAAIDELLAGAAVSVATTRTDGCSITDPALFIPEREISYWADARPVFAAHCVGCHHGGGSGPFDFSTPEGIMPHLDAIEGALRDGAMPPGRMPGEEALFVHENRLSNESWRTLRLWIAKGAVLGDAPDDLSGDGAGEAAAPEFETALHLQRVREGGVAGLLYENTLDILADGDGKVLLRGLRVRMANWSGYRGYGVYRRAAGGVRELLFTVLAPSAPLRIPHVASLAFAASDQLGVVLLPAGDGAGPAGELVIDLQSGDGPEITLTRFVQDAAGGWEKPDAIAAKDAEIMFAFAHLPGTVCAYTLGEAAEQPLSEVLYAAPAYDPRWPWTHWFTAPKGLSAKDGLHLNTVHVGLDPYYESSGEHYGALQDFAPTVVAGTIPRTPGDGRP